MKAGLNNTVPSGWVGLGFILCLVQPWPTLWAMETPPDPAGVAFFESKIRPVLVKHCLECHSVEAGKSKGGLALDTRQALLLGGESGPAIVPGKPEQSLLFTAMAHLDADLQMPPQKPALPKPVLADFETWIRMGAPDPRVSSQPAQERAPVDLESGRKFWSYRAPERTAPPSPTDAAWPRRAMDRFVLARLEEEGLQPNSDAGLPTLLRRLYFDLVGLPPEPSVTEAFVRKAGVEGLDAALASEVDGLLASERFGERWGRHWLDVARFAESNGRESNLLYPHAWRYRDYVIDAVNADIPYDRFLTEQIAGDLLSARDDAERARLLIATGFLALGAKGLNEMNPKQFAADVQDEQIDTVTRAILASSIACARCHDHKSDPFRMEDYYAMAGIFQSTKTYFGTWIDSENNNDGDLIRLPEIPGQLTPGKALPKEKVAELKEQLARLNQEEKDQQAYVGKAAREGRDLGPEGYQLLATALRILWSRGGVEGQLETVDDEGRPLPLCMGAMDQEQMTDAAVLHRGEIAHPGDAVPRGFPAVFQLAGMKTPPAEQSGRLELARWLSSPEHPLTARVMANRVWLHLFGTGLVRTVDNFGFTGERPSHPELLDHLALRFVEEGWSVKSLIREIVLSRSYRQSSDFRREAYQKDPDNRLLWRMSKRRLDAEAIRDSMLSVAGRLDVSRRPGSLVAQLDGQSVSLVAFNEKIPADLDGSRHRSVYLPVLRDHLPDALEQFDFATPTLVVGDRDVTNVPLQALYLLNGPFVREQAAALAGLLQKEPGGGEARVRTAFHLCFNRPPDDEELAMAEQFLEPGGQDATASEERLVNYCQALLGTAEFRHTD